MGEIAPLRELGYSVFVPDYRGFGESEGSFPSEKTVYEDAEAAWNYPVDQRGIRPAHLYIYGHSLGGAIGIELALRHPEAAGLIVESSFTSIGEMAKLRKRYALLPIQLLNQRFDSIQKVSKLKTSRALHPWNGRRSRSLRDGRATVQGFGRKETIHCDRRRPAR
jgi:pimeloyl-ACP methyl ester carboxylesterase